MSRLLDLLIEKGLEQVDSRAGDWFDDFVEEARDLTSGMDPEKKELADEALESVVERKDSLLHLGKAGLLGVLVHLHLDQEDEARIAFFRNEAEFDELMQASMENFDAVLEGAKAREEAWEDVKRMGKELGALVLRAIPLLLAA